MPCRQQPGCEGAAPTTERARAVWMRQQHRIHTGPLLNPRAHRPAPTRPCPAPRRCRSSQHGIGDPERVAGQTASPGAHTHAPARPPPHGCRAGGRTCCRPLRAPARPAQAPHRRPLLAWRRRTKIDGPGSRTISIQTSHAPRVISVPELESLCLFYAIWEGAGGLGSSSDPRRLVAAGMGMGRKAPVVNSVEVIGLNGIHWGYNTYPIIALLRWVDISFSHEQHPTMDL